MGVPVPVLISAQPTPYQISKNWTSYQSPHFLCSVFRKEYIKKIIGEKGMLSKNEKYKSKIIGQGFQVLWNIVSYNKTK